MPRPARKATREPPRLASYTIALSDQQMEKLEHLCGEKAYGYSDVPHARFAFKSKPDRVNLVAYESGKLVVQGKGTEDFVRDYLEAQITGDPRLGYDEVHHPEWFEPHAGLDEAGKGDLFGPLIVACVVADGEAVREWRQAGVRDSKQLTDRSLLKLEKVVRKRSSTVVKYAFCGMEKYNELMAKPGANLNRLLAWLHARALEQALLSRRVAWGLLDQFSRQPLVQGYLKDKSFDLRMRTRAESDPVVAAASICARAEFLRRLDSLGQAIAETLPRGSGSPAREKAEELVRKKGPASLQRVAKIHFSTARKILQKTV